MTTRALPRGWLLSDLPRTVVLLVWFAFGSSLLFYFSDWLPFRHNVLIVPPSHSGNLVKSGDNDKLYTGSIIIVPERGDRCWERTLDNRTGKMWDKGYVSCYDAVARAAAQNPPKGISTMRMRAIGNAFSRPAE